MRRRTTPTSTKMSNPSFVEKVEGIVWVLSFSWKPGHGPVYLAPELREALVSEAATVAKGTPYAWIRNSADLWVDDVYEAGVPALVFNDGTTTDRKEP